MTLSIYKINKAKRIKIVLDIALEDIGKKWIKPKWAASYLAHYGHYKTAKSFRAFLRELEVTGYLYLLPQVSYEMNYTRRKMPTKDWFIGER